MKNNGREKSYFKNSKSYSTQKKTVKTPNLNAGYQLIHLPSVKDRRAGSSIERPYYDQRQQKESNRPLNFESSYERANPNEKIDCHQMLFLTTDSRTPVSVKSHNRADVLEKFYQKV